MSGDVSPWEVLDLGPEASTGELRRRYATLIKQFRPDSHPAEFARVREAYETLLPLLGGRDGASGNGTASAFAGDLSQGGWRADAHSSVTATAMPLFRSLTQRVASHGEDEAWTQFHALMAHCRLVSIDEHEAVEQALLRWVLALRRPPLLMLFECGRVFGWHGRSADTFVGTSWLQPADIVVLLHLLGLARDLVFARHFTRNRWLRRLFTPHALVPRYGSSMAMAEAEAWGARWEAQVDAAQRPALRDHARPSVCRRIRGVAVLSTDFLVVAVCVTFGAMTAGARGADAVTRLEAVSILVVMWSPAGALPLAWLRVRGGRLRRALPGMVARVSRAWRHPATVLLPTLLLAALSIAASVWRHPWADGLHGTIVFAGRAAGAAIGAALLWWVVLAAEWHVHALMAWGTALDRLRFHEWVNRPPGPLMGNRPPHTGPTLPPGRWSAGHAVRRLGEAIRFAEVEIAGDRRPWGSALGWSYFAALLVIAAIALLAIANAARPGA